MKIVFKKRLSIILVQHLVTVAVLRMEKVFFSFHRKLNNWQRKQAKKIPTSNKSHREDTQLSVCNVCVGLLMTIYTCKRIDGCLFSLSRFTFTICSYGDRAVLLLRNASVEMTHKHKRANKRAAAPYGLYGTHNFFFGQFRRAWAQL